MSGSLSERFSKIRTGPKVRTPREETTSKRATTKAVNRNRDKAVASRRGADAPKKTTAVSSEGRGKRRAAGTRTAKAGATGGLRVKKGGRQNQKEGGNKKGARNNRGAKKEEKPAKREDLDVALDVFMGKDEKVAKKEAKQVVQKANLDSELDSYMASASN